MADATKTPSAGASLGTRLFLAMAFLVALAVAAAVVVTQWLGTQVSSSAVERTLERSSLAQELFEAERLERLRLIARLITDDPYFVAYIEESMSTGDVLSIQDLVDGRRDDLAFDFAVVLDHEGLVVARTDSAQGTGQDLSGDPLVREAAERGGAIGLWSEQGGLYDAVVVPMDTGGVLLGFLVAAFAIDDNVALDLRRVSGADVVFASLGGDGPEAVATTLGPEATAELTQQLRGAPWFDDALAAEVPPRPTTLEFGAQRRLVSTRPLVAADGESAGALLVIASLEAELAPYRRLGTILAGVGLAAVLLASAVSFLFARRITRPVRELAGAAQAAAEGDYSQELSTGRRDEIGRLGQTFQRLLDELREKRDMERYITELSRNLPEPDQAETVTGRMLAPESRASAVLGLELREWASEATDARAKVDELNREIRQIANAVAAQSGRLEMVAGHRVLASFEGKRTVSRALSAATSLLKAEGSSAAAAMAIVAGEAVRGPLAWMETPQTALTGAPIVELESLLRGAKPGQVLLSKAAHAKLGEVLTRAGLELRQHTLGKKLPLYLLDAEKAARLTFQEVDATRQLPTAPGTVAPTDAPASTLGAVGPGTVVGDRFVILSQLGVGGMGVVFKARDRELDELVALKMLKPQAWDDPRRLEQLKSELKLARKISHANVLSTFDFGIVEGLPFISMEYVRGITLRQSLDQSGRPPFTAGLRLARQLCRGLAAAHEQGVLHRDIKPENLILEPAGNVKLMDFGIAQPTRRPATSTEEAGVLVGTPAYLAPEQVEGQEPDERADIYASGVVFYEIFTGQLPYERSGNLMQVLRRKVAEDATPPGKHWPEIPPGLERIILRCLERDRDQRYREVAELLGELETLRG